MHQLYVLYANCMQTFVSSQDTILHIIKFGNSEYLEWCVEAGFSQIQSQLLITL